MSIIVVSEMVTKEVDLNPKARLHLVVVEYPVS